MIIVFTIIKMENKKIPIINIFDKEDYVKKLLDYNRRLSGNIYEKYNYVRSDVTILLHSDNSSCSNIIDEDIKTKDANIKNGILDNLSNNNGLIRDIYRIIFEFPIHLSNIKNILKLYWPDILYQYLYGYPGYSYGSHKVYNKLVLAKLTLNMIIDYISIDNINEIYGYEFLPLNHILEHVPTNYNLLNRLVNIGFNINENNGISILNYYINENNNCSMSRHSIYKIISIEELISLGYNQINIEKLISKIYSNKVKININIKEDYKLVVTKSKKINKRDLLDDLIGG